jgi:hypothetical protein
MNGRCSCEAEGGPRFLDLGCLDCGAACCPACAIHLESAVYCRRCAGVLLEAGPVRAGGPYRLL